MQTDIQPCTLQCGLDVIQCLVTEYGADVNQGDGATPLYIAARNGRLDVLRCLVNELGADVYLAGLN
jgi:ankyrin repeat protein